MKMTKKLAGFMALAFSALLTFAFVSCANDSSSGSPSIVNTSSGSGGSGGSATGGKIAKFNISNAKNLYIASKGSSSRTLLQGGGGNDAGSTNTAVTANGDEKLYKIVANEDGTEKTEEVTCSDSEGKAVTPAETPIAVYSVTDTYLFIGYGTSTANLSKAYLVNKSTGAAFDMANAGMPVAPVEDFRNASIIKTAGEKKDATSIYYITLNNSVRKVVKVDLSNPESLTSTVVSTATDNVMNFDADIAGNIMYKAKDSSDTLVLRFRSTSGGLKNFTVTQYSSDCRWVGLDGYIYHITFVPDTSENNWISKSYIKKITVDSSNNITEEDYAEGGAPDRKYCWKLNFSNKIIMVVDQYDNLTQGAAYEVMNSSKTPKQVAGFPDLSNGYGYGTDIGKVKAACASDNYWFVASKNDNSDTFLMSSAITDDIVETTPGVKGKDLGETKNKSLKKILDSAYDVYALTAVETEGITFNALRMSDGKKIIGKVGINGGAVTTINEEGDAKVICLERVN